MKKILWVVGGLIVSSVFIAGVNRSVQQQSIKGVSTQVSPTVQVTATIAPSSTIAVPSLKLTATPTPTVVIKKATPTQYISSPTPATTSSGNLDNNNTYINSAGNEVHSPANTKDGSIPAGATAKCGDGTYSFSQSHSGTCSHHGGVSQWF